LEFFWFKEGGCVLKILLFEALSYKNHKV